MQSFEDGEINPLTLVVLVGQIMKGSDSRVFSVHSSKHFCVCDPGIGTPKTKLSRTHTGSLHYKKISRLSKTFRRPKPLVTGNVRE